MRSRLAITALLATGALMSSGGAALGVSALSTDLTASSAQYGGPPASDSPSSGTSGTGAPAATGGTGGTGGTGTPGSAAVLGTQSASPASTGGAGVAGTGDDSPDSGVAGARTASEPTAAAQAPRQISASTADELPFTGYAAIPMLLIGLALLASGLVLRRGARRAPAL